MNLASAAGSMACQIWTRRLYCQVAMAVPQIEALLLVPSSVAGGALGKVANKAGSKIRPPPPTMASTKPANREASETSIHSMPGLSHPACRGRSGEKNAGQASVCKNCASSGALEMVVAVGCLPGPPFDAPGS